MKKNNSRSNGNPNPLDQVKSTYDFRLNNAPTQVVVEGTPTIPQHSDSRDYLIDKTIELGKSRGVLGSRVIEIPGESIGELVFEDGTEWIGYVGDFQEIFPNSKARDNLDSETWTIPTTIQDTTNRGIFGKAALKLLNIIIPTSGAGEAVGRALALKTDQKILSEGLYHVDKDFNLFPFQKHDKLEGKILLLLHGTLSSTTGSFSGLEGETWDKVNNLYDHIIALEHYTLSKSPIENTRDLLQVLPNHVSLDILSHSRGGLVGDVLSRYDIQNDADSFGFTPSERDAFAEEDKDLPVIIRELESLAKERFFTINNFVRVACPAGGTTLLAERLDHFLNAILNAIGLLIGGKANFLYTIAKEFLLDVVNSRTNADSIPGLWAMVPSSVYQKINNRRDRDVKSKLFVIAGDSSIGGNIGNTLMVILTNIYYLKANDFVVDTKSMKRGLSRLNGVYQYISRDSKTSHFNYFHNDNTRRYILMGLQGTKTDGTFSFEYVSKENVDRGIDLTLKMVRYNFDNVSGKRPIAILLPGIMGSLLNDENGNVWVNIPRFLKGDFVSKLKLGSNNVFPDGVMASSYKKMGEFLLQENDLKVLAYDWRRSLEEVSDELIRLVDKYLAYNQPINIIAHSMGGLVVKQLLIKNRDLWKRFCDGPKNNLILLGTPWLGSHLIMEVLTGHSKRVKQLDLLDWKNGKNEILQTINEFPGVFQLLPITNEGFEKQDFWKNIGKYVKNMVQPSAQLLAAYQTYAEKSKNVRLGENEKAKVFYIAGRGNTKNGYVIRREYFRGEVLNYTSTNDGDGSVTYELGIPKDMDYGNLTYVSVGHGDLANEKVVFKEVESIIKTGKLKTTSRSIARSTEFRPYVPINEKSEIILAGEDVDILDNLLDINSRNQENESISQELIVSVVNADLKYANYPVMVGHFKNDGIYSAEKSLDKYLDFKLSERHKLGFYPADVGDCEIIFHRNAKPKGGLVVGLGKLEDLTPHFLAQTVESAVIKYAFFFRDNYDKMEREDFGRTLSSVIIGNYFAGLSVEDSMGAIISGVLKANRKILKLDIGLSTIQEIEFLDYYEDIAQQAYQILRNIKRQDEAHFEVRPYRIGLGSRKRISAYKNTAWWHIFNATTIYADNNPKKPLGLSYNSTSGKARVEQEVILSDLTIMEHLSKSLSTDSKWQRNVSKSLFELLIPNDFKSILRSQKNILLKLDEYTAQFPWEMFHYSDEEMGNDEELPTFVNTGLIRQLIIDDYRVNPVVVDKDTAFVVGNPDYSGSTIPQLPSAGEEAQVVGDILQANGFETTSLIFKRSEEIVVNMYSKTYKIMHFAAHGIFEKINTGYKERTMAGIVLGDGIFLEPGMINQLSAIPEFIFINCCYSGTMGGTPNSYAQFRPGLAANIGTQLIKMGVKAVVVAGWAVDDAAAMTFSRELYNNLFKGYEFGIAVQKARKATYIAHPYTNTWGAYQCYGDYYYKLNNKNPESIKEEAFATSGQAVFELDNFLSSILSSIVNVDEELTKLNTLKSRINAENLENPEILELYAHIYSKLGKFADAKAVFELLFHKEKSKLALNSIEQYHSISAKLFLENYHLVKSNLESNPNNNVLKTELESYRKSIKNVIEDANTLLKIGETVERLSHLANMNKRASLIFDDEVSKKELLQEARTKSFKAYQISLKPLPLVDQIFPLTNYLLAEYAINNGVVDPKSLQINMGKYKSVTNYVKDLISQLEAKESFFSHYYHANAKSKLLSCWYIYEPKENKGIFDQFESALLWSLEYYGNVKNVYGEIEQVKFLMSITTDQTKKNNLNHLIDKIQNFI